MVMDPSSSLVVECSKIVNQKQHLKDNPDQGDISLHFQKLPEFPVAPLWKVQLHLSSDDCQSAGADESISLMLSPSDKEFQAMISEILLQYTQAISSFRSLLDDERLHPYISRSKYDLMKELEEKAQRQSKGRLQKWPFLQDVLLKFTPYSQTTSSINMIMSQTLSQIDIISKVCYTFID